MRHACLTSLSINSVLYILSPSTFVLAPEGFSGINLVTCILFIRPARRVLNVIRCCKEKENLKLRGERKTRRLGVGGFP